MRTVTTHHKEYQRRLIKTSMYVGLLGIAWGGSVALSSFVLDHFPVPKFHFGIFALLVNVSIGLIGIVAHMRWLRALDEMLRQIFIETMAITFGVLFIAFGGLIILDKAEINHVSLIDIALLTGIAGLGSVAAAIRMHIVR